jgi:5'-nucleotidase
MGINVLYSGTVAAAIEGAFFGITSIAISLQYERHFQFEKAACLARQIIEQVLAAKGPDPQLYNINIPTAALSGEPRVCVVPMNVTRYGDRFEKRQDPFGRPYYWLSGGRAHLLAEHETDLSALAKGQIAITPLDFNMTRHTVLTEMEKWSIRLSPLSENHGG